MSAAHAIAAEPAAPAAGGAKAASAGIRQIKGRHLTLVTDVPADPEVDNLPQVFDLAFPQWCAYFGIDASKHEGWHVTGYLVRAREHFAQAGLWPADLPPFRNGYSLGEKFWLYDQDVPYYRRHLLLHEGTHSFMSMLGSGSGPPWYSEGMAELLATHRWDGEHLKLNYFPAKVTDVPQLGRIKIVQDGFVESHAMSLPAVMAYDSRAHLQNEPYGWSWAACAFLDGHPAYRDRFRTLAKEAGRADFSRQIEKTFGADWPRVCEEWQVFVANLEHGYDFGRMAVQYTPAAAPRAKGAKSQAEIAADHGWQATGIRLEAGRTYKITAAGRYQIATQPRVWWCEPGGVTIDYYHGQPLGILLGAVRPDEVDPKRGSPLVKPQVIGLSAMLKPQESGELFLRINDSAASVGDNSGTLSVIVSESDR